jgi:patatin-like phospholipase/acyl hydrolase
LSITILAQTENIPMANKVRILSIDGGGIRGIIPGVIVAEIEKRIQKIKGKDARIGDYFDLMAGTSTGGILTCCYLMPGEDGKPKFSAEEAVDLYLENGDDIFHRTLKQKLGSLGGLSDEKYDADEMEEALQMYFGDTQVKDMLKPCVITAYNISERKAHFFKSHRAIEEYGKSKGVAKYKNSEEKHRNFKLRDAARATSAAPTYFEAAKVWSIHKRPKSFPLIDGGVFANNPALCAYAEARTVDFSTMDKPKNPSAKDMFLVSISTGSIEEEYTYRKAKDWGPIGWIKPLIDIMMGGNSETVHYQLKQIWSTLKGAQSKDYVRLQPTLLEQVNPEMDDASKKNMRWLKRSGEAFVKENSAEIDRIVKKLIDNP